MSTDATAWRPAPFVRAVSVGLVRRPGQVLVMAVRDEGGAVVGWRPVGGTIEFGERAADALRREFREELGEGLADPEPLCVLENLYTHNGAAGHEIVFVFSARFLDPEAYRRDSYEFVDGTIRNTVSWMDEAAFVGGAEQLFPAALTRYLNSGA